MSPAVQMSPVSWSEANAVGRNARISGNDLVS